MKIIMSCSASSDYIAKWQRCIQSQKKYCEKHGYDYVIDDKPLLPGQNSKEWTWKKHYTLDQYEDTHDIFIGIDADCEIKDITPPIENILTENSIYYVLGISRRPNAGFLIYRNDNIRKFFHTELMKRRALVVPEKFKAKPGGDNGHVIWVMSEMTAGLERLPLEWNCSRPSYAEQAYILHYTNHMRKYY